MVQSDEKDKISEFYRETMDRVLNDKFNHELLPPLKRHEIDKMWDEINSEIDIGEIWNGISSDLDRIMPSGSGSGMIMRLIAAILIVLFGLIPVKNGKPDSTIIDPDILIKKIQNGQPADLIIKNNPENVKSGDKAKENKSQSTGIFPDKGEADNKNAQMEVIGSDQIAAEQKIGNNEVISKFIKEAGTELISQDISQDYFATEKYNIKPALIPDDLGEIRLVTEVDHGILEAQNSYISPQSTGRWIDREKISIGLFTSFKNTWLLNHETFDGFTSESLNTTELVFAPDAGVNLNYTLNNSWSLQVGAFFYSGTGQKYLGYYNGQYGRKKITLRYSTIDFSVIYSHAVKGLFPGYSSLNIIAGNYFSFLHNVSQIQISDISNIGSEYQKYDFGIRLGTEFVMHLTDHLSLAPGLFVSMGIPNIYKGTVNIPGYLRKTRNGSEAIRLTIYYH